MNKEKLKEYLVDLHNQISSVIDLVDEDEPTPPPETAFQGIVRQALDVWGNHRAKGKPWVWIVEHCPNALAATLATFNATLELAENQLDTAYADCHDCEVNILQLKEPTP